MKEVGAYIRMLRRQNRWTQQALADNAGVHINYVSRIEAGKMVRPGNQRVAALVRALQGDLEKASQLLDGGDDDSIAQLARDINSLPPAEREERRRRAIRLIDELLSDPKKLDRWIGYGERLQEED